MVNRTYFDAIYVTKLYHRRFATSTGQASPVRQRRMESSVFPCLRWWTEMDLCSALSVSLIPRQAHLA